MLIKSLLALSLLGVSSLWLQDADAPLKSGGYAIDPGHSSVVFKVGHLGVSTFWGRFNQVSGQVNVDTEDASKSSVSITIPAESVDSNSGDRDAHLKSPDFFNVKEFPEISFKSSKVVDKGRGVLAVSGELTLLGKSRAIQFEATPVGHGEVGRFGYRAGWNAEFVIKRADFGMTYGEGVLGQEVTVIVAIEGIAG